MERPPRPGVFSDLDKLQPSPQCHRMRNPTLGSSRGRRLTFGLLSACAVVIAQARVARCAEQAPEPLLLITADHPDGVYAPGQPVLWRMERGPANSAAPVEVSYSMKKGGRTLLREGKVTLTNRAHHAQAPHIGPGAVLLEAQVRDGAGATHRYLGGAVVAPDKIERSASRPEDFDRFWQSKLEELSKVPANPQVVIQDSGKSGVDYWQITMDNIRGSRIRGQLARPAPPGKLPAMLVVQWAGVYGLPKEWVTDRAASGWLVLNISAHDLPIDQPARFYEEQQKGPLNDYVSIGNDDREKSYFLRMYLSCCRAAQYLAARPDWNGKTLVVTGASQGGLQALVTAGLHPRVTAAIANVPAGCDLTGALMGRTPGWPAYYWTTQGKDPQKVLQASCYFDAVNFAARIRCPVLVGVGLVDEVCSPAGILAALNEVKGRKEIVLLTRGDHQGSQDSHKAFYERADAWLEALKQGADAPVKGAPWN